MAADAGCVVLLANPLLFWSFVGGVLIQRNSMRLGLGLILLWLLLLLYRCSPWRRGTSRLTSCTHDKPYSKWVVPTGAYSDSVCHFTLNTNAARGCGVFSAFERSSAALRSRRGEKSPSAALRSPRYMHVAKRAGSSMFAVLSARRRTSSAAAAACFGCHYSAS